MEAGGLLTRRRNPANRRVHLVELTPAGEDLFQRLAAAAVAHDRQLRAGLTDHDLARLEQLLDQMRANLTS